MKWAVLGIVLAGILPFSDWLRRNPRHIPKVWTLFGFLPFVVGEFHLLMAVISWADWPGYVKGAEVSVLDILAAVLFLSRPRATQAVPFKLSMVFYFLAVLLSALQASVPTAALFDVWQLARVFLVYVVVARACSDERVVPALLMGMLIGLCYEACDTVWERFFLRILQAGGSLGHQNLLGLMSHFVVFPWFALLLAGERGWRPVMGPLAGVVVAVLTVSRATIGLAVAGYSGLFVLSGLRGWTTRKTIVFVAGLMAAIVATPVVLSSFETRFLEQPETDYDERGAFEKAAAMIISDHPFGVGANSYVVAANVGGYNSRAGVAPVLGSDSANVHNVYYLVTAETGYIGLVAFIGMLLQPLFVAFRCGWRNRNDRRGDLLLGLGMSLLVVYLHSFYEWIFVTYPPQYMFAIEVGLVAGLAAQLGYWRRSHVHNRMDVAGGIEPVAKIARN